MLRKLKQKARQLKAEVQVLFIAYKDKRTPFAAIILIGITVGYLLSPIDLIPDFIPVLGLLDDLIIVPLLITISIKQIPTTVLADAREQAETLSEKPKKNNWIFAIVVVLIWLVVLVLLYKWLRSCGNRKAIHSILKLLTMERWIVYAIISMPFAGLTSVIAKFGMKDLSSDTALAIRTSVVFSIVIANVFVFRNAFQELLQSVGKNILFLAISGITTSLSWIFYYRAMKEGQVLVVASIDKASIVVTLLLSFIILKEPITPKFLLGAGFILTGMAILVWK